MRSAWGIEHTVVSKAADPQRTARGVRRGIRGMNLGAVGSLAGAGASLASRGRLKVGTGAITGGALGAATGAALPIKNPSISKGVPKGLLQAAAGKRAGYAAERVKAHTEGKFVASIARPPKQYQNQGLPEHHLLDQTRTSGQRARTQSRLSQPKGGTGNIGAIRARPGAKTTKATVHELFGRGPSKYSGRSKPWSRSA